MQASTVQGCDHGLLDELWVQAKPHCTLLYTNAPAPCTHSIVQLCSFMFNCGSAMVQLFSTMVNYVPLCSTSIYPRLSVVISMLVCRLTFRQGSSEISGEVQGTRLTPSIRQWPAKDICAIRQVWTLHGPLGHIRMPSRSPPIPSVYLAIFGL